VTLARFAPLSEELHLKALLACTQTSTVLLEVCCFADTGDDCMDYGGEVRQCFGAENSDPNTIVEATLPRSKNPSLKEKPGFADGDIGKALEGNKSRKRHRAI
jgi:hypothetical protein